MQKPERRITARQLYMLFAASMASPIVNLIPACGAGPVMPQSVLYPIVALPFFLLTVVVISALFRGSSGGEGLAQVLERRLGRTATKAVCVVYFIWILVFNAYCVYQFALRYVSLLLPETQKTVLCALLLIFVGYVVLHPLEYLARMGEIVHFILLGVFLLLVLLLLFSIDAENFRPIPIEDIPWSAGGGIMLAGMWSTLTVFMFAGGVLDERETLRRRGIKWGFWLTTAALLISIVSVGILGYSLCTLVKYPFFTAVKSISSIRVLQNVQPLFIAMWTVSDFVITSMFIYAQQFILSYLFPKACGEGKVRSLKFTVPLVAATVLLFPLVELAVENELPLPSVLLVGNTVLGLLLPAVSLLFRRRANKTGTASAG